MLDLANVFYLLGILFFLTCFLLLVIGIAMVVGLYQRVKKIRSEVPMKMFTFLRNNNTTQLKAFGIALVGYILAFLRGKVQEKKKTKHYPWTPASIQNYLLYLFAYILKNPDSLFAQMAAFLLSDHPQPYHSPWIALSP